MKNKANSIEIPQWYIITVVNGSEDLVIRNLKGKIEAYGLSDLVQDIKVIKDVIKVEEIFTDDDLPSNFGRKIKNVTWETFKDANGKTKYKKIKTEEVNRYYGYIFIKMIMTDDSWYAIRNTQLITGIVGSSGKNAKPIPVGDDEIGRILNAFDEGKTVVEDIIIESNDHSILLNKQHNKKHDFHIGQTIKIINGQFVDEKATIMHINEEKEKLFVTFNFFGRDIEAEIDFNDCELDK